MSLESLIKQRSYSVTVSTEKMHDTADDIKNVCDDIARRLTGIEKTVRQSAKLWDSQSGALFKSLCSAEKPDTESFLAGMQENIKNLNLITELYKRSEEKSAGQAESLRSSILK